MRAVKGTWLAPAMFAAHMRSSQTLKSGPPARLAGHVLQAGVVCEAVVVFAVQSGHLICAHILGCM